MSKKNIFLSALLLLSIFTVSPYVQASYINYDLAFPGMLPDNSFYKLKALRDKIAANFIVDPKKKIEFYLLQTDKGILASAMLVDKGKIDLAAQTALKAEHNFTLISQITSLLEKKIDVQMMELLETAALKHQEVLLSLSGRVPKEKQDIFIQISDFSKRNIESIGC